MAYYTAAVARAGSRWKALDVDVDSAADVEELGTLLTEAAGAARPVLLLVEREDEWWAVVRVDDEEEARIFVSDLDSAARSRYGELLGVTVAEPVDADEVGGDTQPGGDPDLLDDLGSPASALLEYCGEDPLPPLEAVSAIAGAAGFADLLEGMR